MERFDHLIIGAGISGLGMAHLSLRRGLSTLVLERSERCGGCIRSHTFAEAGGFWAELGAHTGYNSYGHMLDILGALGLSGALTAKQKLRYSLLVGDEIRSVFSRLHPLELLVSLPRLLYTPKEGRSVESYYSAVVGGRNYRDLFRHAFGAVICQPAGEFPAELLFRRKPRRKEVIRSFTLPRGIEDLVRGMAAQDGMEIRLERRVRSIERAEEGFLVAVEDEGSFRCRYLTLAVPPDQAASLLREGFGRLPAVLGQIRMSEIASVAVCAPREAVELPPLAGLIGVEQPFNAMVSRDYLADPRYRGFTFHFRDGGEALEERLERIARVLRTPRERFTAVAQAHNRLPALRAGHGERVREIDAAIAGTPLALTGNYFQGVSMEDCLARSAAEMERLSRA